MTHSSLETRERGASTTRSRLHEVSLSKFIVLVLTLATKPSLFPCSQSKGFWEDLTIIRENM